MKELYYPSMKLKINPAKFLKRIQSKKSNSGTSIISIKFMYKREEKKLSESCGKVVLNSKKPLNRSVSDLLNAKECQCQIPKQKYIKIRKFNRNSIAYRFSTLLLNSTASIT
eukprot:TRINITY_DN14105_c0_g1_i8.p2 TRINITY_DN14105_c0_g1~~TRINITY_DN14105_c0_g1_i8.p2  ORF type:complete len:112 (+),score=23.61 TRINITY_DN14105_c0_g1_i8:673-1008(+)